MRNWTCPRRSRPLLPHSDISYAFCVMNLNGSAPLADRLPKARIIEVAAWDDTSGARMETLVNIAPHVVHPDAYRVHGVCTQTVHDPSLPTIRHAFCQSLHVLCET